MHSITAYSFCREACNSMLSKVYEYVPSNPFRQSNQQQQQQPPAPQVIHHYVFARRPINEQRQINLIQPQVPVQAPEPYDVNLELTRGEYCKNLALGALSSAANITKTVISAPLNLARTANLVPSLINSVQRTADTAATTLNLAQEDLGQLTDDISNFQQQLEPRLATLQQTVETTATTMNHNSTLAIESLNFHGERISRNLYTNTQPIARAGNALANLFDTITQGVKYSMCVGLVIAGHQVYNDALNRHRISDKIDTWRKHQMGLGVAGMFIGAGVAGFLFLKNHVFRIEPGAVAGEPVGE